MALRRSGWVPALAMTIATLVRGPVEQPSLAAGSILTAGDLTCVAKPIKDIKGIDTKLLLPVSDAQDAVRYTLAGFSPSACPGPIVYDLPKYKISVCQKAALPATDRKRDLLQKLVGVDASSLCATATALLKKLPASLGGEAGLVPGIGDLP